MDPQLQAVAVRRGGFFTRADALEYGWLDRDLKTACRAGLLRHIRHGAYAWAATYDLCDESAQHLMLARAAVARQRGPVALAGVSAAAAHGLVLFGQVLDTAHLVRMDGGSVRNQAQARHHIVSDALRDHVEIRNGLLVTSLARTLWEVCGQATLEAGVATLDSALRLRPAVIDELAELAPHFAHTPGSKQARAVMGLGDGRAESPGESYSRVLFVRHGLPKPELQHEVRDQDGDLLGVADFYWPEDRHLGEFDGKIKYGRLLRPGEQPGDAVYREKRREDRMRGQLYGMSRWVFADMTSSRAGHLVARVDFERAQSRRLYLRPGQLSA